MQRRKEKKRKDCAFQRQYHEKPSIIPGCPGSNAVQRTCTVVLIHAKLHLPQLLHAGQSERQKWCSSSLCVLSLTDTLCLSQVSTHHSDCLEHDRHITHANFGCREQLSMWRSACCCMEPAPTHAGTICAFERQAACCSICTNGSHTEDETLHHSRGQFPLQS